MIEKDEINICLKNVRKGKPYGVCIGETIGIFLERLVRRDKKGEVIDKFTENFVAKCLGNIIAHEILHREIYREGIKVAKEIEEEVVKEVSGT